MDDGTYMYFGPWPAVLRMPVAAVTKSFDNRLSQVSMLLGYIVALAFSLRLAWRVRTLTLGDAPVGRFEAVVVGSFVFVVGTGSALVFLGGQLLVFQEALLWGVAWSLGALELVIAFTVTLRARWLVLASLLTLLALFSRAALGAGPLIALGLLLLVTLVGRGRGVLGLADGASARRFAYPAGARGAGPDRGLHRAQSLEVRDTLLAAVRPPTRRDLQCHPPSSAEAEWGEPGRVAVRPFDGVPVLPARLDSPGGQLSLGQLPGPGDDRRGSALRPGHAGVERHDLDAAAHGLRARGHRRDCRRRVVPRPLRTLARAGARGRRRQRRDARVRLHRESLSRGLRAAARARRARRALHARCVDCETPAQHVGARRMGWRSHPGGGVGLVLDRAHPQLAARRVPDDHPGEHASEADPRPRQTR